MEQWQGRVAVVTGASTGIGAAVVESLVRSGLKVVGIARRLEKLQESAIRLAKLKGNFYPVKCDLRKEQDILSVFKFIEDNVGPVSIMINNAGVLVPDRIVDGRTDDFRQILDVNVVAVAICVREATKSMRKHKIHGHIINVNSVAGHNAQNIKFPVNLYSASKYAVTGMTESIRNELSIINAGIKITSVSPGAVRTDMIRTAGVPDEVIEKMPILESKDIADAIMYALSTPKHVQVNELTITPLG